MSTNMINLSKITDYQNIKTAVSNALRRIDFNNSKNKKYFVDSKMKDITFDVTYYANESQCNSNAALHISQLLRKSLNGFKFELTNIEYLNLEGFPDIRVYKISYKISTKQNALDCFENIADYDNEISKFWEELNLANSQGGGLMRIKTSLGSLIATRNGILNAKFILDGINYGCDLIVKSNQPKEDNINSTEVPHSKPIYIDKKIIEGYMRIKMLQLNSNVIDPKFVFKFESNSDNTKIIMTAYLE